MAGQLVDVGGHRLHLNCPGELIAVLPFLLGFHPDGRWC